MRFLFALIVAALVAAVFAELNIEVTFKPDDCDSSRKSVEGDKIFVHYTGSIDESSAAGNKGEVFDSSLRRNRPFSFELGAGKVIKGWDQGLLDMCKGEKRVLTIPPELGYGDRGAGGSIPGGATLKFEVECIDVQDNAEEPARNIFSEMDKNADGSISYEEFEQWFKDNGHPATSAEITKYFAQEDKNQDQTISWAEFGGPKGKAPKSEL